MAWIRRLRWGVVRDEGVAMITVLGVMTVVTLLAIGAFMLARQALFDAERVQDESRAFRVANAGIDSVLATFDPAATEYAPVVTPDGTATISVGETGGDAGEYEIIASGLGRDGSAETVVQRFFYINLWEMNFAGTGSQSLMSGSSGMNGSSNIWGPFYIKGDLAVEANMSIMEGPLFVKGGDIVTQSGASQIGTTDQHVRLYCDGEEIDIDKGSVWVDGPFFSVPTIELPGISQEDMQAYSVLAIWQSNDGKMSQTADPAAAPANLETSGRTVTYKYYDDTPDTIAPEGEGTTTLHLGTAGEGSFGSWGSIITTGATIPAGGEHNGYADPAYNGVYDDFAYWDNYTTFGGNTWDLLFISGTVFVDGPLIIDDHVMYIGNGTIVANGPVTLDGALRPYSYSTDEVVVNKVGEDNKWALGIVTPFIPTGPPPAQQSITMNASGANNGAEPIRDQAFDYAGAYYTDGTIYVSHPGTSMRGSMLSNKMDFADPNTDLVTNPLLPTYLPESLPGGGEGIITLGQWSRH